VLIALTGAVALAASQDRRTLAQTGDPGARTVAGAQPREPTPDGAAPRSDATSDKRVFRVPRERLAELWFANRLIIVLRSAIVPREPAERVEGALRELERLADDGVLGPVRAVTCSVHRS
jgi:hypothetical protein